MATEADIPGEPLSITKNGGESINLERLVDETIPGEVKKLQGMLSLCPDTAQFSAGTENKQAAMEPEIMISVVEGNVETAVGEKFFDSPYAVEVASVATCEVSKHFQDEEAPNQGDKEMSEDEKQVSIEKIEVADETGSGRNDLPEDSEEILEKNDTSSDIADHPGNGLLIEKIEESNLRNGKEILNLERVVDQHAEVVIDQNVSIEDKNIEKEIIDVHKIERDGILEATGETGSKEVEYEEAEKSTDLVCQARSPEAIEPCERVENEKDEKEISMYDNAGEIFIPCIAVHPHIQSDEEAALKIKEGDEETVYKPSITTATNVSNIHEAGPEAEEKLKEASGVACEENSQDITEPSEEMKYMTQVEDEMSQQHSIETFATQTEDIGSEKIENPESFKVPQEIQSGDIIKENPKEAKEEIEVIEKIAEDDIISSEKEKDYVIPEQEGDASFTKSEGTLRVNEEVAAADSSSGENRYEEGSTVIVSKDYSDDTEIVNALEHSQEGTSKHEERQENLQQNEQEKEKLERSLSVLNEDFIESASTEYTETTACVRDEAPIKVQEESFEEKITDALEHRQNGISDLEERPEDLQLNRPEKEKIEESSSAVAADFSMASATESDETSTCVKGETPSKSQEENCEEIIQEDLQIHTDSVSKNEIAEEKNIPPFELNEKIECAQVEVPNTDANGLHVTDPLIEAAVENEGKNSDKVSNSEPEGQVREANEASMEEEKHIEDAPDAHQIRNCTISEHPSTEGGVKTELIPETSEKNIEKLQEVCGTESEEKSEIKDSGENTDQEMQNNEEVCDTVKPQRVAESDDAVKSAIEVNIAVYSRDEKVEQELQTESPQETAPALTGEDESYAEDNNKSSNDTNEEVHDGMNITGRGVPVNEQVMEGVAAYISEESIKQEIDQVTPGNENKAEKLEGENNIEQTSEESNNRCLIPASVEQVTEDLPTAELYENSKTEAEAESIDHETSKTIESSDEITATETSVEEKPHINEQGEKLEQPFSLTSDKNETFSSVADKTPCLMEDGALQNLEEAPENTENEKESEEEKNNVTESKITAEEDLQVVAKTSDATRSTESIASELKSEMDNVMTEDEVLKEESKEIHEDIKEAGKDVENEKRNTVEEFGTTNILPEPIGEKILQSSEEDETEEETPKIEAFAQLQTTSLHKDAEKQTPEEENIVDQSSELEVEKTKGSFSEDHAVACISSESVEPETVEISGEKSLKQIPEETNITGHIQESVEEVPSKNTEDNEKKSEILENSKTEEAPESFENETSNTVACPKEILDTTQGKQGENALSEEKNITATESSPEEKPQENGPEDKLERTLSLVSRQKESFSSDANKTQCPVEEGASQYLEEAPQNEGKETEKDNDSKEDKIAIKEDLRVLDETTEARKSIIGSAALELQSEMENIAVGDEIKKEESKESEDTEKHDSLPIGEKVLQSFEEDKKEEETPKFEASAKLETTSIDEDAEKKTLKEENIIDQSREIENEKIKQSSIEEETSRIEACSPLETTSLDEAAVEKDLEKENIVEHSRELEIEKIEECSKEDNTVAYISSGSIEQDTVKISQGSENKAEESEGDDNIREQIVSAQQVPIDDLENEEKREEETTGENFENSKTVEAAESTENGTSKTIESPKEILDTIQERQDESLQSEGQNPTATESTPEENPQKNESAEKLDQSLSLISDENGTLSSDGDKTPCLMEEEAPQNIEEVPEKGENGKESEENSNAKENKITAEEDLQVVAETSDATRSIENITSELHESTEIHEDSKEVGKDVENEKRDTEEEFVTTNILPEPIGEKILQSSEEDEKEKETPKIEACAQLETIGLHQDAEKQVPEEENIADHSSELGVEKIEQSFNEDYAVARIPSESVEQETVDISGEKSVKQIVGETNVTGQVPESVEQIPFKNTEDNEKKAEDSTAEIIANSKTEEESESIEHETSRTIESSDEITATETSVEEKPHKNEPGEKLEQSFSLTSDKNETFSSDADKTPCLMEDGAPQNLEEAPEKTENEKESEEEKNNAKESKITAEEDLQVGAETSDATISTESIASKLKSEVDNVVIEDEILKEESKEIHEDSKETGQDVENEKRNTVEEFGTTNILREPIGEKILQSSEKDEKAEDTPKIEAFAQLETTSIHEDTDKQTPEEENIVDQSSELEVEKTEGSFREDHAIACISSESVVQETVEISGEKIVKHILEETNVTGQVPESVEQVPFKNTEDSTAEIIENSKTEEKSESIENERSRTIDCPKENVQSEGNNITATESSPEEKSQENESGEKIERTLLLVSDENASFTSDANEIHCMVEKGPSQNLKVAPEKEQKETEEKSDTEENEIAMKEDLQVLDETTEASKSLESIAPERRSEIENIAVEDEIKKEESNESEDLKDTEKDEETEKHDSVEELSTTTILPEPFGEKVLDSEDDKKEEEMPFETSAQLATTGVHEDAEKQTLEEESIVDQSRELEVEKSEQSSREEETPRTEECSQHETTTVDEDAGEKDLEKENIVEKSRELEIENIEESSKEDNTVAYISSGSTEQDTVKISQGNENKAEELEGENDTEQIVKESSSRDLILESVQQVPIDNLVNEENKAEETTGENFENSKTAEATESIENETSKTIESPKEILDTIQEKQDESMQSEGKNPTATGSIPEEKRQKSELSLVSDENETVSSDGDKIPCLMEEEPPQNLEEVPKKEEIEKEAKDNNDIDDSKIAIEEDLEVVTKTSDEGNSTETIILKPKSEVDNIVIENELKKEESKQLCEDCKDGVDEKHDITEECSSANILPEPVGEKVLQSSEEDKKEEETPKFEACALLETTSVDEDAEKQTLNEEGIADQSRELDVEKVEQSSREEETPRNEASSQLETTNIDEDTGKKDLEKENIVEQSGELEIEKIEESSKEENTVAYISSESIEQETVEISQGNVNKAENSEENSIREFIPESVDQSRELEVEKIEQSSKEDNTVAYISSESIEQETVGISQENENKAGNSGENNPREVIPESVDESRELEVETIEQSSKEENTVAHISSESIEQETVDISQGNENGADNSGENNTRELSPESVDQYRELEVGKIEQSSKEDNTVASISSESIDLETVEVSQRNEDKTENSGENNIEQIIEDSRIRGLITESVQQVPVSNLVDEEKKAEETSVETFESSKKEEAAESIAHETSETIESPKEILDTFPLTQVESLLSERKNQTATESSQEEKINEDRSPVIAAEENNNDKELVDNTEGEDDMEQCSKKNETGGEIEQPLSLKSNENDAFSSDLDKIPHLMEEGASQNLGESQKKEESEKETEETNNTGDNKLPKEEDLQVADEKSNAIKSTDSITLEQKLEVENMEVEDEIKKEASKELYEDCNDAGKDKETEKQDKMEECSSTNVLPQTIKEKMLHSSEQDKKEEETSKIEACAPHEITTGDEDAEKQTLKEENIVEQSKELNVELEHISKEDDMAAKVSEQKGCEVAQTVDEDEDAGKQNIVGETENKSEAFETADYNPSREKQYVEEDNKQGFLCTSVVEETVEESSREDKSKAVKLKEEVDESNSLLIEKSEATNSTEETVSETLNDSVESNADSYPSNITKASEGETPPKEIHGCPVETSTMVLDVSSQDKEEEITAKEEINIDAMDSATVTVVTEEICLQEAEPEDKKQVQSFGPDFEEKSMVETEAKETMLENIDMNVKPEDIPNLGQKSEKEIPPAADQAREEIGYQTENQVPHAGSEDQKEMTANDVSVKEISKEVEYSTVTSEENELMTSNASETIDEIIPENQAPYDNTETTAVAQAIDTVVMEKQDRTTHLSDVSELEPVDTGKKTADEEVQQGRVEDLYLHPELDIKKYFSVSEDVQTLKTGETTELADHSDSCTSKTLKDVESSHLTPNIEKTENENPFADAMKSTEASDVCTESEKSFVEQEILKGSSEEGIEVEKAATELKEEASSQRQEDIDTNDGGTKKEEIFMSAGPEEKLQQVYDVVAGDQSNVKLPESDKSEIEEHCSDNQIQEDEKEIKEKDEPKLEVEDQKEQNANGIKKAVLITEKVHEGVEKCDDCKDIKGLVVEEEHGFNELHASSTAGESTDKVQDSSLVSNKVEESKEKTEIEIAEVEEVSTTEREAFFVEQLEEQQDSSIEPPGKESKEEIEEVIEESQDCYRKADNETLTTVTETSQGEAELGDILGKALHTDLDEPWLEATEFVHSQQSKEVDSIKLEETSCDLASELQTKGNGHTESESITREKTDIGEPEEIETASKAVYESEGQGSEETDFGKSQTVEKPDQVSTNDHDHAERKNVVMENSDTAEVDDTKVALDAVGKTQDPGSEGADETGKSSTGINMDRVLSSNFEHSEEDSLALESPNSIELNETNVVSDAIYESKDQGSEASAGESLVVEKLDQDLATNSQEAEKEKVTEEEEPVADEVVETKLSSDVICQFKDQGIDETGKSLTAKQVDVNKSEEGCTETTDDKVHGVETVTEDEIISEQIPSAENLEQLPTPASGLPLKHEITNTVVKIEEEKAEKMEMPKDEGSEIFSTAKPTEEISLQNDGPREVEVPMLESNNKDIKESPTEVLVQEEGSQTIDDAIQLEPIENEKIKCVESGESLTAEKPDESEEACKETSDHRAEGVEPATEGEITAERTPLTEKLEEQLLTPTSALPFMHGTKTTVEKIKEEKTKKLETLEDEGPEDSSAAKRTKETSLLKDSPRELEVLTLESTSNKDIKYCPDEVLVHEEGGQTSDGALQVESPGNETKILGAHALSESREVIDLTRPTETACNLKFETSEKDLEPEKTYRTTETTETGVQAEELSVETVKATASEAIGKVVVAEDRSFEDSDHVLVENKTIKESFPQEFQRKDVEDSATKFESRNQGEESNFRSGKSEATAIRDEESSTEVSQKECIKEFEEESKLILETQKSGKISSATTEKQISTEADAIKCSETTVSSGDEYVPPVLQERLTETSQIEAEDLKPGNSEWVHSEVKEVEHGGEKRIDGTEEETSDKSTLVDSDKSPLSDFSQKSTKETLQLAKHVTKEGEPTAGTEERHSEEAETITDKEEKSYEEKDEAEGDEHQKTDSGFDAPVMVEASRDMDVKVVHKKSHGLLSGVGSKVKHSISKVKKAITGKSSHHSKPVSPK